MMSLLIFFWPEMKLQFVWHHFYLLKCPTGSQMIHSEPGHMTREVPVLDGDLGSILTLCPPKWHNPEVTIQTVDSHFSGVEKSRYAPLTILMVRLGADLDCFGVKVQPKQGIYLGWTFCTRQMCLSGWACSKRLRLLCDCFNEPVWSGQVCIFLCQDVESKQSVRGETCEDRLIICLFSQKALSVAYDTVKNDTTIYTKFHRHYH